MKHSNRTALVSALLALALAAPSQLLAEAAEHEAHIPLSQYWGNFLIYCAILYFALRRPVVQGWAARRSTIEEAVMRGKRELAAAQQRLTEAEHKLSGAPQEIKQIGVQIAADAERESAQIVADAENKARITVEQAKESGEAELQATETAIRRELAEAALQRAEERLRREWTAQNDQQRRQSALSGVQGLVKQ